MLVRFSCVVTRRSAALVLPKAESVLKRSVQPYINSILEALMEPISRGFAEVRDVFFREVVDISKNLLNGGDKEKLAEVSRILLRAHLLPRCVATPATGSRRRRYFLGSTWRSSPCWPSIQSK